MKLIDKKKLIDEINKRLSICNKVALDLRNVENKDYYQGKAESYKETLDILDTIETKEMDLDKEFDRYCENLYVIDIQEEPFAEMYDCAKHFYELGLNSKEDKE